MKKALLASTALVLSAGVAVADVTVSGDGRMGVLYYDDDIKNAYGDDTNYAFTSRIRIIFTASGETDGGLVFGGSVRADHYQDGLTSYSVEGEDTNGDGNIDTIDSAFTRGLSAERGQEGNVFISGDLGKLSMGDVDGGTEVVIGDLAFASLTGLGDFNEILYLFGGNDPSALYEYSAGGLTLALGVSDDEEYSAGVGFDGGIWSIGLGYEKLPEGGTITTTINGNNVALGDAGTELHQLMGAAAVTFAGITVKGVYGRTELDKKSATLGNHVDQWGLSAEGTWGAVTAAAYYRKLDADSGGDEDFYGAGAEYDLGGGAAVAAGVASIADETVADFGVKFAF